MNLTNFLKQTDALTLQCSAEQLVAFVHDIARGCPEYQREDFLKMLKSAGGGADKAVNEKEDEKIDFAERYRRVRDNLKRIDSQELTITGRLNEEYDDWYSDSGQEDARLNCYITKTE